MTTTRRHTDTRTFRFAIPTPLLRDDEDDDDVAQFNLLRRRTPSSNRGHTRTFLRDRPYICAAASRDKAVPISKVIVPERANDCDTTSVFNRRGGGRKRGKGISILSGPAGRPAATRGENSGVALPGCPVRSSWRTQSARYVVLKLEFELAREGKVDDWLRWWIISFLFYPTFVKNIFFGSQIHNQASIASRYAI